MRKFLLTTLVVVGLGGASLGLAVSVHAQRGPAPAPISNCSIPGGGCAGVAGGGCRGACTDGIAGNDIACRCTPNPDPAVGGCYCEAYDPWWGG